MKQRFAFTGKCVAFLTCALIGISTAVADFGTISGDPTENHDRWSAKGGATSFEFITSLLDELRIDVAGPPASEGSGMPGQMQFAINKNEALDFWAPLAAWDGFTAGGLKHPEAFSISWPGGRIDSDGFYLRPAAPDTLELVDSNGNSLFRLDHIHTMLYPEDGTMTLWNMDMSMTPWLANQMGYPDFSGAVLATAFIRTGIEIPVGGQTEGACATPNWHDGVNFFTDVELSSLNQVQQVARQAGVRVAIAPSATLRNVGTADVPWFEKFTTEPPQGLNDYPDPYSRDQHPFLVWAMYRIVDDIPQQIGQSAVKHAFFTVNSSCSCSGGHILWTAASSPNGQACTDTYGVGNNNSPSHLGVRSEVPSFTGAWEQCGSMFAPGASAPGPCDQTVSGNTGDSFERRLVVAEEQLETDDADYFFEGWYVIRDDINIYNTMAYKPVTPTFGSSWSFPTGSQSQGPAIDAWVPPDTLEATQAHTREVASNGHFSVAVKVTPAGGSTYRYVYAVMNYDYDPRFNTFAVPLPAGVNVNNIQFLDGDNDSGNDWTSDTSGGNLTWTAPNYDATVEWGHMVTFVFEASHPPVEGPVTLMGEERPEELNPVVLGIDPNPALDFIEGFESP